MIPQVLCLRPQADFDRVGVSPPASLQVHFHTPSDPEVCDLLQNTGALLIPAVGPPLPAEWFENASIGIVQVTGAGLDRLDRAALQKRNIAVANVPGGSNAAVAEYVITACSYLLRRFGFADHSLRAGDYAAARQQMIAENLRGLEGLRAGIIGFGTIGSAVARRFHQQGCEILYYDPNPADRSVTDELNAKSLSLPEVLRIADVISLHLPLLPSTQGLIGENELALMKPDAILIQASRGGIVDEAAVARRLQANLLGGAAFDVFATEPPPQDSPLFQIQGPVLTRLLLTPHIAGVTRQSSAYLFRSAWQNVERVLVNKLPPLNRVY